MWAIMEKRVKTIKNESPFIKNKVMKARFKWDAKNKCWCIHFNESFINDD